jgi:hypothetical protein
MTRERHVGQMAYDRRMKSRANARLFVVLAAFAFAASACTQAEGDAFLLALTLLGFGAVGGIGSVVGSGIALVSALQRKPRGFVNLGLAVPSALASMILDAFAISMSANGRGVDRDEFFLMAMTATPVWWLAATVMSFVARPKGPTQEDIAAAYREGRVFQFVPPPLTAEKVMLAIVPPLCALAVYTMILYALLPEHKVLAH